MENLVWNDKGSTREGAWGADVYLSICVCVFECLDTDSTKQLPVCFIYGLTNHSLSGRGSETWQLATVEFTNNWSYFFISSLF